MGRALSVMRATVRSMLDETSSAFWEDNDIDAFINKAIRTVNRKTRYLVDPDASTITLADATRAYDLEDDCPGPERIVYLCDDEGTPIPPISFGTSKSSDSEDFVDGDTGESSTYPDYWYRCGKQIAFYPIPKGVLTVSYWYIKTPAVLAADDDVSPFCDEYDDLVEWLAAYLGFMDREEYEAAQHPLAQYQDQLKDISDILSVYAAGNRKNKNSYGMWPFKET